VAKYSNLEGKIDKQILGSHGVRRDRHRATPIHDEYIAIVSGYSHSFFGGHRCNGTTYFYNLETREFFEGPDMN